MKTAFWIVVVFVSWFLWQALPLLRLPDVCLVSAGVVLIALAVGACFEFYRSVHGARFF